MSCSQGFREYHPYWSITPEVKQLADKAMVMNATIKDMQGIVIATARKKETETSFPDYIEKAETGQLAEPQPCADTARWSSTSESSSRSLKK